jgi:hypothetical protein
MPHVTGSSYSPNRLIGGSLPLHGKLCARAMSFLASGALCASVLSCGGGGGGGGSMATPMQPAPPVSAVPNITVPATVIPLQQINIAVTNPIAGAVYSAMIDAGNGTLYQAPIEKLSETSLSIAAPPGAVSSTGSSFNLGAGNIRIAVGRADSTGTVQYSGYQSIAVSALNTLSSGIPMGAPIIALLRTSKIMLEQASANLSVVANKTNFNIKVDTQHSAAAATAKQIDVLIAAVQAIQANPSSSSPWTTIGGTKVPLNAATITLLDQMAAAQFRAIHILAASAPAVAPGSVVQTLTQRGATIRTALANRGPQVQGRLIPSIKADCSGADCDIIPILNNPGLPGNELAQAGYRAGHVLGQMTGVAGGILIAAGLLSTTPVWVTGGIYLAAAGFFVATVFPTAIGTAVAVSSGGMVDGQSSVNSLKAAGSYFANQYADLAISSAVGGVGKPYVGEFGTNLINTAESAEAVYAEMPALGDAAYADGSLPVDGIPSSNFAISIQESNLDTNPAIITITTSPPITGMVQLVVTDDFGSTSPISIEMVDGQGSEGTSNNFPTDFKEITAYDPAGNATAIVDYDSRYPAASDQQSISLVQPGAPPVGSGGSSGGSSGGGPTCSLGLTLPSTLTFALPSEPNPSCDGQGIAGCGAGGSVTVSLSSQQTAYCPTNPLATSGTATVDGLSISVGVFAFIIASDCSIIDVQDIATATGTGIDYPAFDLEYQYGPCAGGGTGGSNTWTLLINSMAGDGGTPTLQ